MMWQCRYSNKLYATTDHGVSLTSLPTTAIRLCRARCMPHFRGGSIIGQIEKYRRLSVYRYRIISARKISVLCFPILRISSWCLRWHSLHLDNTQLLLKYNNAWVSFFEGLLQDAQTMFVKLVKLIFVLYENIIQTFVIHFSYIWLTNLKISNVDLPLLILHSKT